MMIVPKNWSDFQHYKDRRPPWIKLHHSLLDDVDFLCLPLASRALAPLLWLLASEYQGGEITLSLTKLAYRLRMSEQDLSDALKPLVDEGFFVASEMLAKVEQSARLDREETETETEGASAPPAEKKSPGKKVKPWMKKHGEEVVRATQEIMSFWPDKSQSQPKSGERVPESHGPILADRLSAIAAEGGDLRVCVAIAARAATEFRGGGVWIKAAENWFGKSDSAPWQAYYRAHLTNQEEVAHAS